MVRNCLFVLSSFLCFSALAEYRAFLLRIAAADNQAFRQVVSNLDPEQYPGYYPLAPGEKITYTDTWMCRGRTNQDTEVCPNPKRAPNESSDSQPSTP